MYESLSCGLINAVLSWCSGRKLSLCSPDLTRYVVQKTFCEERQLFAQQDRATFGVGDSIRTTLRSSWRLQSVADSARLRQPAASLRQEAGRMGRHLRAFSESVLVGPAWSSSASFHSRTMVRATQCSPGRSRTFSLSRPRRCGVESGRRSIELVPRSEASRLGRGTRPS